MMKIAYNGRIQYTDLFSLKTSYATYAMLHVIDVKMLTSRIKNVKKRVFYEKN